MPPPRRTATATTAVAGDVDGLSTGQRQFVELAEDWLAAKRAKASDHQAAKGSSDRARRSDLCRIARLVCHVTGRAHLDWGAPSDIVVDVGRLSLADLSTGHLTRTH